MVIAFFWASLRENICQSVLEYGSGAERGGKGKSTESGEGGNGISRRDRRDLETLCKETICAAHGDCNDVQVRLPVRQHADIPGQDSVNRLGELKTGRRNADAREQRQAYAIVRLKDVTA